jgi:von Willebrand factor type A domain
MCSSRRVPWSVLLATLLVTGLAAGPPEKPVSKPQANAAPKPTPAQTVVSRSKSEQTGKSAFLKLPGSDRYASDQEDWSEVPAWRRASFYGIRARGQFFIYVVDCSGSMIDEERLTRAKEALRKSVRGLQEPQRFHVIFYNDQPITMPGGFAKSAGLAQKDQFTAWLRMIEPDGETDPRGALGLAIAQRPDAIFLLSDGEYPGGTVEAIGRINKHKVPIHCVDLSGGVAGDQLQRIAHESGGTYAARPWNASGE